MHTIPIGRAGVAAVLAVTSSALAVTPAPAWAAPPTMTLSSTAGPSGGGNTITATATGVAANALVFPTGTAPVVQFQFNATNATTCKSTAQDNTPIDGTASTLTAGVVTTDPSDVRRISTTKIAFTVPSSAYPATVNGDPSTINTTGLVLVNGQASAKWNVCVYDSASTTASTLIATSVYTLALRPTITAILPARSPAFGGQTITVNGTGFGAGTTAAIDGAALTDLKLAANGNSFSATTSAHARGTGYSLVVKTAGGPVSSTDPDNNGQPEDGDGATSDAPIPFTFDNSITISPNTAPAGSSVYLDIRGVGFSALAFDVNGNGAPTDSTAHVFLVRDAYDAGANRGVQECLSVLVLDDTEIICQLDLAADSLDPTTSAAQVGTPVGDGTYTVTVVADGTPGLSADDAGATLVTSGASFTVAPY
jgi:IPT/TIG domain